MKKTIIFILSLLILANVFVAARSFAGQRTESFVWEYEAADEANIDGFKIFMDGGSAENVVWEGGPTERTATISFDDSKKSHSFSCIAWAVAEDETILDSDQSNYAVWILPKEKPKKVDSFVIN